MRRELRVAGLSEPLSHYTDAVAHGGLLFVSGCAPLDSAGDLVGGDDVRRQTRQVLENLQTILRAEGLGFGDIVKVTVFLTDVDDRQAVDELRREFFGPAKPASTLIEVSRLAVPQMKVEIEAIAGYPTG